MNRIIRSQALAALRSFEPESFDLIYIDPPFGTGDVKRSHRGEYQDPQDDYLGFLSQHLVEAHRVLKRSGSLCLHLDWHNVHGAKLLCDDVFGRSSFLNEVIWAYDFGGRGRDRWPRKHDNILVYVKDPDHHIFNWDDVERIPYMAPLLQSDPVKLAAGKVPTDVWWMSIVGTNSAERLGYPTQKPVKLVKRFVVALAPADGVILDFFAGSGTTGAAASEAGRSFVMVDSSSDAIDVMKQRFSGTSIEVQFE